MSPGSDGPTCTPFSPTTGHRTSAVDHPMTDPDGSQLQADTWSQHRLGAYDVEVGARWTLPCFSRTASTVERSS